MATKLEIGQEYEAKKFRSGENSRGPWEMAIVGEGKGKRNVLVFFSNIPSGVVEGGRFTIDKINDVVVKAAKDANGNWTRTEVVVNAEVTAEKTHRTGEMGLEDFDVAYDLDMDMF